MIVERGNLYMAYKTIRQDAMEEDGCTVIIFVSPDVDALCAARIMTDLFRSDCVAYKMKPVSGYESLGIAAAEAIEDNEELRSIILIGCGAIVDLNDFFELEEHREELSVYVIDSHRPYSLDNVRESNTRVRLLDYEEEAQEYPSESDSDDDDDDSDDSSGDDSDVNDIDRSPKVSFLSVSVFFLRSTKHTIMIRIRIM
jgi:cell division control protein 45